MRFAAGVAALLLTSMYMILLGVLIDLAPRPLYFGMAMHLVLELDALVDQQLCGFVMLVVGAASLLPGWVVDAGRVAAAAGGACVTIRPTCKRLIVSLLGLAAFNKAFAWSSIVNVAA